MVRVCQDRIMLSFLALAKRLLSCRIVAYTPIVMGSAREGGIYCINSRCAAAAIYRLCWCA